jgi:hypothetical protein
MNLHHTVFRNYRGDMMCLVARRKTSIGLKVNYWQAPEALRAICSFMVSSIYLPCM